MWASPGAVRRQKRWSPELSGEVSGTAGGQGEREQGGEHCGCAWEQHAEPEWTTQRHFNYGLVLSGYFWFCPSKLHMIDGWRGLITKMYGFQELVFCVSQCLEYDVTKS